MTIREEILSILRVAGKPLGVKEIFEQAKDIESATQVANNVYVLKSEGAIESVDAESGKAYQIAAGGGGPVARKSKAKPAKRKGAAVRPEREAKKRSAGLHKVQRNTATPAVGLWALRSDGEFFLTGTDIVIPRQAVLALIKFIRLLDRGEVSA